MKKSTIKVNEDGVIYLENLRMFVDIDRVVYYNIKHKKNGNLVIKLYDKKKKLVRPYVK